MEIDELVTIKNKRESGTKMMNGTYEDDCHTKHKRHKILKTSSFNSDGNLKNKKVSHYKNRPDYVAIFARPDLLKPLPKMYQSNFEGENTERKQNCSLFDIFTIRSLNTDVNDRFSCIPITSVQKTEVDFNNSEMILQESHQVEKCNKKKKMIRKIDKPKKIKKLLTSFFESENQIETESVKEDTNVISYADFYEVSNRQAQILHLHHPCKFSFHGELKFTALIGEVEILGYTLSGSSNTKTVKVYSPEYCTPLVVQSKTAEHDTSLEEIKKRLNNILSKESIYQILEYYKPNDAILLVEQLVSTFGSVIHKYTNLSLFPKNLEDLSAVSESLKKLQSTFKFDSHYKSRQFNKNLEWDEIPLKQCTVLCGGKGVGKSTLLKYYVNQTVSKGEKVLVLDFDPGQPEFSPPGFLSAVIVDEPLLGPNFTHVTDGKLLIYFGSVNTTHSPNKYLECVNYIIQWWRKNEESLKMKVFVNTMGFCKGLGIELMISILKLMNPDVVIQIQSCDELNNYPFLMTPENVNKREGFADMMYLSNLSYDYRIITSSAEIGNKRKGSDLTPIERRNLMLLSYFSQMMSPPYYNLNAAVPYLVSFDKVYLAIDTLVQPKDILKAFNGNLVSLSEFEPTTEVILTANSQYFKIVLKPKITPSYGLGLVRGIDCEKKKIYIVTHLNSDCIKRVNCLTLGRINLPSFLFLKQDTVTGHMPYTSISTSFALQRVKRKFRVKPV